MRKEKMGNYRWRVVVLLFFASTINYIDRQVIAILAEDLQKIFNLSESDYGFIIMSFKIAYAIGLISTGGILDKIGTKLGYTLAVILWSIAGMFHAVARGFFSFAFVRFMLGIGESANFPAAVKSVAEWFPKRERALATGLFNTGTNIASILTPLIIPIIALKWGWQIAFIGTGALGFIWLLFWIPFYKRPEKNMRLSNKEKDYILQDDDEQVAKKVPWKKIFPYKQTLGICLSRFFTDPIWWFFLYWLPKFLYTKHGIDLKNIGPPLVVIYMVSAGGSVAGGWLSSFFIKRGKDTIAARKLSIFLLALLVIPIFFAATTTNMWIAVALIALAAFTHQGYAANIFTIVSDIYPKNAVGSVVGLSGFAGAIGGILFTGSAGLILEFTGSYYVLFGIASVAYLLCWIVLHLFVPNNISIKF